MNLDTLKDLLVARTGISEEQADKVIAFLQEHASDLPALLGKSGGAGGLMDKARGFLDKD